MSTPLLTTKLYIPPFRPSLVLRPRLIEQLNEGLRSGRRLTLISAPAGFGKTTLLSEWIHRRAASTGTDGMGADGTGADGTGADGVGADGVGADGTGADGVGADGVGADGTGADGTGAVTAPLQVAWLSLDEGDNDPARFLSYAIAALRTIEADIAQGALSALQSPQPPPIEGILISLINEIAAIPNRIVLVLDDYHLIQARPVHDALIFTLEHLPPQMHLVIATREDPHLPLARLRARGQLNELRATHLRFSSSEAAEFLNQVMGLNLSAEDIAALETKTEGWIAGLQLAALALRGTSSMQGHKDASSRIQSFTGSHRFVLDYLIEEVLDQQSASVQTFLLQTCILDRLTGSLCDAVRFGYTETPHHSAGGAHSAGEARSAGSDVQGGFSRSPTGQTDSQAILEALEAANLFIVPLDEERRWYRYHHLFAELLRQRLHVTHPDLINDLHSRAVIWYETHDDLPEAIRHALAIDDVQTATRLIEKGALEALQQSELRFILKWVDRLPESALESSPSLFIYHAWALVLTGQVESVSSRLEQAQWLLNAIEEYDETQKKEMLGYIAGLKAILALWQRDLAGGLDFANQALENLPDDNWIRGYCAIVMGSSFSGHGNLDAARDAFAEAYSVGKAVGNQMLAVSGACNVAYILELGGHLQQEINLLQDMFQLAEQDGQVFPVAGYIHIDLARALYQLNDLDAASRHLKEGIELCRRLVDGRAEKIGHCLLARVQLAQGEHADVLNSIQKAASADPSPGTSFDLRGGEYPQIWLWLGQNRLTDLEAWLKESGENIDDVSYIKTKLNHTMRARALIALGRERRDGTYLDDAFGLLEELLEIAGKNGWGSKIIEILALQALAYQAGGDTTRANAVLERALTLAEPEGFIRIFVDEGPPMARLLYEALNRGIAPEYVRRLLIAFPVAEPEQPEALQTQVPKSDLIEPLSERELELLQLVAEGLTNPEIAARLFLSLNTVKAHTRNIYAKLAVHNRTQAVAKARALGVLPPT